MKRSTQIGLSAAGLLLVASAWSLLHGEDEQLVYDDAAACRADRKLSDAQCEQRFDEARVAHLRDAKKFGNTWDCEAEYGPGRCQTRAWNGAEVVVPALAGLVVARSLFGGGVAQPLLPPTRQACPPGSPSAECQPGRSASSGGSGSGGSRSSGSRAYTTTSGQSFVATGGTTRASVTSRGGFGSTGHSFGSSSGS